MGVNILIMNEDKSRDAYEALKHLIKKICQLLCPVLQTQHLMFSPTPEELEGCVRAGQWQSANPRHRRQQAVALFDASADAVRRRSAAGAEVGHRTSERVDQLVDIEDLLNLAPAEQQHGQTLPPAGSRMAIRRRCGRVEGGSIGAASR